MPIISESLLENELPDSAENANNYITMAVNRASGFVNTWTSKSYDPWDNYDTANDVARAPSEIVAYTINIAKLEFNRINGVVSRDEDDNDIYEESINRYKEELSNIDISPIFVDQTISLDSNYNMLIGSRTTTSGIWTRVIPKNAFITSAGSSVYIVNDDFWITKGGTYDDEYPEAWYLRTNQGSSVEGTLSYMRTYRKDMKDYAIY